MEYDQAVITGWQGVQKLPQDILNYFIRMRLRIIGQQLDQGQKLPGEENWLMFIEEQSEDTAAVSCYNVWKS